MNKRIRYVKTHVDGIFVSMRVFTAGTKSYKVQLDTTALVFAIVDAVTNEPIAIGEAPTVHALKIAAKDVVSALGCSFEDEKRKTELEN